MIDLYLTCQGGIVTTAVPARWADDPRGFARWLSAEVAARCEGALVAAYLHGSAALGGWVAQRSDVDVLFVVADDLTDQARTAAGDVLVAAGTVVPGRDLECSVVTVSMARRPAAPWPFVLHVAASAHGNRLVRGDAVAGDPDLIMHYVACRAAGVVLLGPPPSDCVGPVGRPDILGCLADDLGWGLANAPECYAVLNACRALAFLADDQIVSKVSGGLAAIESGLAPADLVRQALDQQQGRSAEQPPGPQATAFVRGVIELLRAAVIRMGG